MIQRGFFPLSPVLPPVVLLVASLGLPACAPATTAPYEYGLDPALSYRVDTAPAPFASSSSATSEENTAPARGLAAPSPTDPEKMALDREERERVQREGGDPAAPDED